MSPANVEYWREKAIEGISRRRAGRVVESLIKAVQIETLRAGYVVPRADLETAFQWGEEWASFIVGDGTCGICGVEYAWAEGNSHITTPEWSCNADVTLADIRRIQQLLKDTEPSPQGAG